MLAEIEANPNSLTGRYLSGKISIPVPTRRRAPGREKLVLRGARANNLRGLDVEIPLGLLVAITGVSGSGKSTLVHQVLYRAVARALGQSDGSDPSGAFASLSGVERLNDVVLVDQTPIGRTPRSNPVTYIKGFDLIRELFASQPDAKRLSLTPGHFSFNVPGGRCNTCEGDGTVTVEMQFLADVELPCEECNGTRYQTKILDVQYKGKNIHEVLQMTVKEALRFFTGQNKLLEKLAVLDEIGLGYLRLGQSATTLSGGEAQRVKLAAHLASVRAANASAKPSQASRVLYILDEPTTGLHFDDVSKLLTAFRKLIDGGGSLVVIEHNLDVIKSADWVIDMGPEGGEGGGRLWPKARRKRSRRISTRTPENGWRACCEEDAGAFMATAKGNIQRLRCWEQNYSATTGFVSAPKPSTVTVTLSPGLSQRCGLRPIPTPEGVPVETTSPGSSGVIEEMYSISSGTGKPARACSNFAEPRRRC